MSLNLTIPQTEDDQLKPRITVIGIGGAGGNAVTNMINSSLEGVEFLVCNTDAQALSQSGCPRKIQLGRNLTRGLGAGARPDVGRAAAEEAMDEILTTLDGCNMVFITAGMGGGTGTGAAPVIARAAREQGILTVGVVTKPFHFEGVHRMRLAESGIQELTEVVDTLIIIPNQNLFRVANEKTTFADAFKMADDVLESGVRGVTDLMVLPGLINLDFNDIRTVMTEMGKAMMGTGEADGEDRAIKAAEAAIANPLLDDVSMRGARGVLINITGGTDLTLFEVDEAANKIREQVDPEANIIFGSCLDDKLDGKMRVSIVATGIDVEAGRAERPQAPSLSLIAAERERRRPQPMPAGQQTAQGQGAPQPAPSHPAPSHPAVAAGGGGHEALRAQPVTLSAAAQVLQPEEEELPRAETRSLELEPAAEPEGEYEAEVLEVAEEEVQVGLPEADAQAPSYDELDPESLDEPDEEALQAADAEAVEAASPAPSFLAPEPHGEPHGEPQHHEPRYDPEPHREAYRAEPEPAQQTQVRAAEQTRPDLSAEEFARTVEERRESFVAPAPAVAESWTQPIERPQPAPAAARPQAFAAPQHPQEQAVQPDPFREAELANASRHEPDAGRGRGPSLISKVTGLSRLLGGGAPAPQPSPHPSAARGEQRVPEQRAQEPRATVNKAAQTVRPGGGSPQPAPARPAQQQPAASRPAEPRSDGRSQPAQPRLNLDPADRRPNLADEHMLDIPAFLRRQAN